MGAWPSTIVTVPANRSRLTDPDLHLSMQIDELQRLAKEERDKRLGQGWIGEMKDFYSVISNTSVTPTYRPKIAIPQLQTLMLNEATDLTSDSPRVYILQGDRRDEPREAAFQANWRQGLYNNRLFESALWALLCNNGWLQVGFDPWARGGRGMVWLECRDPESVYPDPAAKNDRDWFYLVLDDWMYIDEVRRRWPDRGHLVKARYGASADSSQSSIDMQLPPGPMSIASSMPPMKSYVDARVRVRQLFIFDNARERIKEEAGTSTPTDEVLPPKFREKYPGGRWLTECEGTILADGPNPWPKLPDDHLGTFPVVRVAALPGLYTMWGPPPVKYTRGLQELGERMYSQVYENAVRLNNGIWFIDESTGIDIDAFGGIPGEVQIIHQGSQVPQLVQPKEMPSHMVQLPALLFQLQKELQGFTPARAGQPGQGNISADLFDASLFQSQFLTRLRGRLLAEAVQRVAELTFYSMARFLRVDSVFHMPAPQGQLQSHKWDAISDPDEYSVMLDPGSIHPVSGAALRTLVVGLAKQGLLPVKYVLEALDIPGAGDIAEESMRQAELAALAKLKRPR
jgi:hypothetical protein